MMRKIIYLLILMLVYRNVTSQPYQIGDLYVAPDGSQGVVFHILPNGDRWVVALNDASTGSEWGDASDVPGLTDHYSNEHLQVMEDISGYANTLLLRNYQNNSSYAAGIVDVDHGWFLPSVAQLSMLYGRLPFISTAITQAGGTDLAGANYWSCMESSKNQAWSVSLQGGGILNHDKNSAFHVRAVCCIPNPSISYMWSTGDTTSTLVVSPMQTGQYTVTVTSPDGISVTATKNIVVACKETLYLEETVCDYYVLGQDTLTETGDYRRVFTNTDGVDSIVMLRLKVLSSSTSIHTEHEAICDGDSTALNVLVEGGVSTQVSVGDILCTDNSIVKLSEWPVVGKTAMGVVFYVDYSGKHGWAVHLFNQGVQEPWGLVGVNIPTLKNCDNLQAAINDLDGYGNTLKIREAGDASAYPAAWMMDVEDGWYLPAAGQLSLLISEIITLNQTLQQTEGDLFPLNTTFSYWSSTERGRATAWYVLYTGSVGSPTKQVTSYVRGVHDF